MDCAMRPPEVSLKDYIAPYEGHAKIFRLISIIEAVALENAYVDEQVVRQAIQLGLDLSANTKAIGLFFKIQGLAQKWASTSGKQLGTLAANSSVNINQVQAEYNTALKRKESEINSQMKTLIKDSMRISLKELG